MTDLLNTKLNQRCLKMVRNDHKEEEWWQAQKNEFVNFWSHASQLHLGSHSKMVPSALLCFFIIIKLAYSQQSK